MTDQTKTQKIIDDFGALVEAANDGYWRAVDDSSNGCDGASDRVKHYGDAEASIPEIKRILQGHHDLVCGIERMAAEFKKKGGA